MYGSEGRMPGVVLTRVHGTVILTLQGSADSETLATATRMLAEELGGREARGVVLEISACEVIDVDEFSGLIKLIRIVKWLGVGGIIAGLRPGLVAYLVSAGVLAGTIPAALDLDQALLEIDNMGNV